MNCKYCEDTGIVNVSNGPDDYYIDYCGCETGVERREAQIEREVDDYIFNSRS